MRRGCLVLVFCVSCARPDPARIVSDPVDASPIEAAAPKTEPKAKPKPETAWCGSDAECAWDDPCVATACIGKGETGSPACEESAPRPGKCLCAEHKCTLARNDPTKGAAKTGCKSDDECAFEPATGSCVAGVATPIHERGGFCACSAGTCTPSFVDSVPCTTNADCSWLENPRRPAPASKVPRPSPPVVPCKTGEFDSVCVTSVCVIRAWKC